MTIVESRKKERRKKPDELLSSVVKETPVPAVIELLRLNTPFIFPSGTAWVMLMLSAEDIGGLSKRHSRNEAKGSIIELIGSDLIHTVATAEMLREDVFGVIPDEETLGRMQEYSLLTHAEYQWAVVWQKPNGDLLFDLVTPATFSQALAVATGDVSLKDAVGSLAWAEHSGLTETTAETETLPAVSMDKDTGAGDAGDPIFDEIPDGASDPEDAEPEPNFATVVMGDDDVVEFEPVSPAGRHRHDLPGVSDPAEETAESTGAVGSGNEQDLAEDTAADLEVEPDFEDSQEQEPVAEDPAEEEVQLVDQDQARQVIARRFLSEDLDLVVDMEAFETTFTVGAATVQIAVPEGTTEWLGDQVAQLTRQANADLVRQRLAHHTQLRSTYVNLMSRLTEQIIQDVATDRDGSRYKQLKDSIEDKRRSRQGEKEEKVRTRKAAIVSDYEEQAHKLGQQAALQAELQYKERNRPRIERMQTDAAAEVDRLIDDEYSADQQEILRIRRNDAGLKMQVGTSKILAVLSEDQSEQLIAEQSLFDRWRNDIDAIVDDNRKADLTRAETLAEHQRSTDELGDLRRDQEAKLTALQAEHAETTRRMETELDRSRQDAINAMQSRDVEWQHSLSIEQQRTESQTARVTDLLKQIEVAEDSVGRRYEARLTEMAADRDSYAGQLERASRMENRFNKLLVVLVPALVLVMTAVGFILGFITG